MKSTETDSNGPDALTILGSVLDVAGTLVVAYVEICAIIGEDQTRLLKMTVFRAGENYCQSQAVLWARLSDTFKRAYDRTRLVA